jgi:hypothetical protein
MITYGSFLVFLERKEDEHFGFKASSNLYFWRKSVLWFVVIPDVAQDPLQEEALRGLAHYSGDSWED